MSRHIDTNAILEGMVGRTMPRSVIVVSGLAILAGLAGFAIGMAVSPAWAWGAVLVGLVYSLGIAQGGAMFSTVQTLTWGRWGRPLKRIGEAQTLALPVLWVLLLVFLLAGHGLYPWSAGTFVVDQPIDIEPHGEWAIRTKPIWLSMPFFIARQLLGVGFLMTLSLASTRASLRPDMIQTLTYMRQRHPEWKAPGWWSWFASNPKPIDEEVKRGQRFQSNIGPLMGITYAMVFSMLAFDLIMSLSPWWYANMFGAWFFASSFLLGIQFMTITALLGRDWLGIRHLVTPAVTHDVGKLTLAFTMFWAYTLFAQILPIWYANMPEETDFLLVRMALPQWSWLAQTVAVLCFLMPFTVLTSRGIKKMKWPFIALIVVHMFGLFLERTLLVMPSVWLTDDFPVALLLFVSIPVVAGFVGVVALVSTYVLASVPPIVVSDPRLQPHPWDVHVHAIPERGEHAAHH